MIRKMFLKWLNMFLERTEEDYRMANIAGVIEDDDRKLMKEFRAKIKSLNQKCESCRLFSICCILSEVIK